MPTYPLSLDEMRVDFQDNLDALSNTAEIAKRCDIEFDFSKNFMPQYDPKPEKSIDILFEKSARAGMERRFKSLPKYFDKLSDKEKISYQLRLDEEIELIHKMGFSGYFLVVSDFIKWAKDNDIPVGPGRGSAAGSLVAYALDITEIDPIRYSLLFERFLNPERVSLPDIDVDFCIHGREKVIEYVYEKYGHDKVAQIITFGTLKAKAAIKDVGRVLGMSYAETDRVAKLIPAPRQGFDYPIAEALKMEKQLAQYARGEGETLIKLAQKLEGLSRHTSTHAAGLVIAERPIVEFMPLMLDKEGQIITQFTMNYVEKIGLVKFDFLGLKTLSVIHRAVSLIKQTTGKKLDLNLIPLDDKRLFKLISHGRTIGVFQLESSGITEIVSRLKPNCFEDIVAILALYRPGPLDAGMVDRYIERKHGREKVSYLHPRLEKILKDTYGIILYQEQIMQIARDLANYSLGQADMLRRAMGKKKPEEMAKQRKIFLEGANANKIDPKIATEVFDQMETFARYGFNRSHSVAYAMISYQTAFLKAHFPKEFMAALMSFEMGDTDKILKNLNECRELKIAVLAPDVNKGQIGFNVTDGKIVFGLAALKGVGEKVVVKLMEERAENGNFKDFLDFCIRMDSKGLNKRAVESFVKSGAFDWTGQTRAELFTYLDENMKIGQKIRQRNESPQIGLFDSDKKTVTINPNRQKIPEWPKNIRLTKEREAMGVYLSGHPLERFAKELQLLGARRIDQTADSPDKAQVSLAGIITLLKLKNTRKGDRYASFVLEDTMGTIEALVWPKTYRENIEVLTSQDPVVVGGKLDVNDERKVLIVSKIESITSLRDKTANLATIKLGSNQCSNLRLNKLKSILATNQGRCRVMIVIENEGGASQTIVSLPENLKIEPSEGLCNQIEQIFGESVLSFS